MTHFPTSKRSVFLCVFALFINGAQTYRMFREKATSSSQTWHGTLLIISMHINVHTTYEVAFSSDMWCVCVPFMKRAKTRKRPHPLYARFYALKLITVFRATFTSLTGICLVVLCALRAINCHTTVIVLFSDDRYCVYLVTTTRHFATCFIGDVSGNIWRRHRTVGRLHEPIIQ